MQKEEEEKATGLADGGGHSGEKKSTRADLHGFVCQLRWQKNQALVFFMIKNLNCR